VNVRITEAYRGWTPPSYVLATVEGLTAAIPPKYLAGLSVILLTNQAAMNHDRRRGKTLSRGRKVSLTRCLGLYHPARKGQRAWIELFVDQVIRQWPDFVGKVSFFRELYFARTLYHEVGHHIHASFSPEHRGKEDVADVWRDRLVKHMLRQRHKYLRLVMRALRPAFQVIARVLKSRFDRRRAKRNAVGAVLDRSNAT
jgi:hypothetical protein